jgi:hypothetical protein
MYIVVPRMAVAEVSIIGNYRRGETFDLEMCFAPQRRALFLRRNFQKVLRTWREVFLAFSLSFAPQRRAIHHLSSGQLAPHPPLSGAYFSTVRSPKSLEKHSVSRLSYLFAHLHLLSSYSFSSTLLSSNQISFFALSRLNSFWDTHQGLERRSSPGLDHAAAVQSNGQTTVVSYQFLHPQRSKHPQAITSLTSLSSPCWTSVQDIISPHCWQKYIRWLPEGLDIKKKHHDYRTH